MNFLRGGVLAAAAIFALTGCHFPGGGGGKAPTGQVVATVGDREITIRELHAEMGDAAFTDPKARKDAEEVALRKIVGRIVLADSARAQGLDKTPDYALQKNRAVDVVLAQALQQKIVSEIPQPSNDEVQSFINAHPDIFVERKIFSVDQIRMERPSNPGVLKSLEPLKTLEQVQSVLTQNHITYQRATSDLDVVGLDPTLVDRILKLPKDEMFVIPVGAGLMVSQIKDTKVVPFTGQAASDYAGKVITRQRTQEAVNRSFGQIMSAAAPTIRFNKDYAPPAPPSPAKAPPAASRP